MTAADLKGLYQALIGMMVSMVLVWVLSLPMELASLLWFILALTGYTAEMIWQEEHDRHG